MYSHSPSTATSQRLRAEKLRMEGILPRDSALIRKMAQEPERVQERVPVQAP